MFLFPGTKDRLCLTMGWSDTCPPEEWLRLRDADEAKAFLESQIPWMKDVLREAVEDLRAQKPFLTTVVRFGFFDWWFSPGIAATAFVYREACTEGVISALPKSYVAR